MADDRKCSRCGGVDEFVYELDWQPVFYCATCNVETTGSGAELIGPGERRDEEAGE